MVFVKLAGGQDRYEYKISQLANNMTIILSRKEDTLISSAAVAVKTGGFADPKEFPGIAHFLEHMLFMGTEKHPNENHFSQFLSEHNGYSNAYTADEVTNYHFQVSSEHLKEALDVFSGFFTCPLLKQDALRREINAVDSEHQKNLISDAWRQEHLLTLLAHASSPESNFQTGNKETLASATRDVLLAFYRKHYRPDRMVLAIHGKESFEDLQGYAEEYFSSIRPFSDALQAPIFHNGSNLKRNLSDKETSEKTSECAEYYPYAPWAQGKVVQYLPAVEADGENALLCIVIPLPPSIRTYKHKGAEYIRRLLEGGGPQSFSGDLIFSGLATDVSVDFHSTTLNTKVFVCVSLIGSNPGHIQAVSQLLTSYLELIKANISSRVFEALKELANSEFSNLESLPAMDLVVRASSQALFFPPSEFVSQAYAYEWSDEAESEIRRNLDLCLEKGKWMVLYKTRSLPPNTAVKSDKVYGITYAATPIPQMDEETSRHLEEIRKGLHWNFPEISRTSIRELRETSANTNANAAASLCGFGFIPIDVEVSRIDPAQKETARLLKSPGLISYHIQNDKFQVRDVVVNVAVENPAFLASPETYATSVAYNRAFSTYFETKYRFELQASSCSVSIRQRNYETLFEFSGLPVVIEQVMSRFLGEYNSSILYDLKAASGNSSELPPMVLSMGLEYFQKRRLEAPFKYSSDAALKALGYPVFSPDACIGALSTATRLTRITKGNSRMLVAGNATLEEFQRMHGIVERAFREEDTGEEKTEHSIKGKDKKNKLENCESPASETAAPVFVHCEDPHNRAVLVLHTVSKFDCVKNAAISWLLQQILQEDFFNQVRTQDKFGYVVQAYAQTVFGHRTFQFLVQSQKPVEEITDRIFGFISQGVEEIPGISPDAYKVHQESARLGVLQEVTTLSFYASRVFLPWLDCGFDLSHHEKIAQAINSISQKELAEYARDNLRNAHVCVVQKTAPTGVPAK